jgi:hypothetical protein
VRGTVEKFLSRAGCITASEPVGEMKPHIDSNGKGHELRADIHADDLRANSTTLLLDTSITQITGNSRDPTHRPQARQGKRHPNADPMERAKKDMYEWPASSQHNEFIPLVMDTYGRIGKPFLELLKDVADHQARRISGAIDDADTQRRLYTGDPRLSSSEQSTPPRDHPRPRLPHQPSRGGS